MAAVARSTAQVVSRADSRLDRVGWTAFEYAPFRYFIAAMLCSTSGLFLFNAALGWYVLQVTGSAAAVGLVFSVVGLPVLLLMPHAGVLTDRLGARTMLIANFIALGIVAVLFGSVALGAAPDLKVILVLAVLLGIAETIGSPATMAIVNDLVPPAAVSSATALNFLHMNVARIIGGVLGGLILATLPTPVAFFIAALLFATPIAILVRVRMTTVHPREERTNAGFLGPIMEASRYAISHPTLGVLILLAIAPGSIGLSYTFMLPVAAEELGIGAAGLGALVVAVGIGGLVAGVSLETIQRRIGHGRALFCGCLRRGSRPGHVRARPGHPPRHRRAVDRRRELPHLRGGEPDPHPGDLATAAARPDGRPVLDPVLGDDAGRRAYRRAGRRADRCAVGARPVRRRARHRGSRRTGCQAAARRASPSSATG